MVDIVSAASATPLRITVRPNCAFVRGDQNLLVGIVVPVGIAIGLVFWHLGAWPVVPFVALALAALLVAGYAVRRHADDFERITLTGDRLFVDRHDPKKDEHYEFNGHWVQVVCHPAAAGGCDYLAVRSHGREVQLGHDLTDGERASVGAALISRLGSLRRWDCR